MIHAVSEDWSKLFIQQRFIAGSRIASTRELSERERALSKILESENTALTGLHHGGDDRLRGIGAIARTACGTTHP